MSRGRRAGSLCAGSLCANEVLRPKLNTMNLIAGEELKATASSREFLTHQAVDYISELQ